MKKVVLLILLSLLVLGYTGSAEARGHGGGHWPTKEAEIAGKLGVTPVTIDGDLKEKETK